MPLEALKEAYHSLKTASHAACVLQGCRYHVLSHLLPKKLNHTIYLLRSNCWLYRNCYLLNTKQLVWKFPFPPFKVAFRSLSWNWNRCIESGFVFFPNVFKWQPLHVYETQFFRYLQVVLKAHLIKQFQKEKSLLTLALQNVTGSVVQLISSVSASF